jgi:uncharacterized lipoprotein YddW (UPF0748 family)
MPQRLSGLFAVLALVALTACGADVGGASAVSQSLPGTTVPPTAAPLKLAPARYRALWVDAFHEGIHSRAEIDRLVDTAHRANLNALFVQVRKNADAYYLSSLEPVAWDIWAPRSFDPLGYLLKRAHAQVPRLEVHAWVNTFFVNVNSAVYYFHGADWGNRTVSGQVGGYLDPGNPAVRNYTHQVLIHLATHYDLDGLHLDFVRYPEGGDWGYSPAAVAAFDASAHRTGRPDPADAAWSQWRRNQVTTFVRDLYHDLGRHAPRVKLSAALIPWGPGPGSLADWAQTPAVTQVYQDWYSWLREGILDLAVPMNYDVAWGFSAARWFQQWIEWEKDNQFQRRVLIGVGAYFNYPEDTLTQLQRALEPSLAGHQVAGVAIYSYASTSLYGTDDYYADPAAAADLPRQPYAAGLDAVGLAQRAQQFNRDFWALLTAPGAYVDPVLGQIATQPVFTEPASTPRLPWKH